MATTVRAGPDLDPPPPPAREPLPQLQGSPAASGNGPTLGLIVDHDDAAREYAYTSEAGTFTAAEGILDTAQRLGWTVASMRDDWVTVFG